MKTWERKEKANELMNRIQELQMLCRLFIKPVPKNHDYVERHREYMKLENELDDTIKEYFTLTGKGKLINGGYFK